MEQLCHNGGVDGNTVCDHPHPGSTILAAAAASGTAEGVRALLGLGADTYVADESGNSPLMMAAAGGYHTVVKVCTKGCRMLALAIALVQLYNLAALIASG